MFLSFLNPIMLWILLFIPAIIYIYLEATKKRKKEALKFSSLALVKKAMGDKKRFKRNELLFALTVLAMACLIISLSDPHIPLKQTKQGVNVILILDDSGSMQANDYSPNRLEAAKQASSILVNSLQPKDEVGIIIFENGATTASYLTPFKDKALQKLMSIRQRDGKTAIGDGLALGVDMASSVPNKKRVIILLSDGVQNAGVISPDEAVEFAKTNKIQIYTIGMGSEGKTILGYDWFGNPQYAELDEKTLQHIADQTGGKYFKSVDDSTLKNIYKTISEDIKREKEPTSIRQWFVVLAVLLLIAEIYLRYWHKRIIQ